jgi:hypothetical protein
VIEESKSRPWLPFLCLIAASALAHLWCLGSQFYLDDFPQIRDSEVVRSGDLAGTGWLFWTTLGYHLQFRVFGMSAVGFHAVNWILHTATACVLLGFGRDFVRNKWPTGVALFGALLFAVHPLASEIPNYARTQDLAWVTLFSLLAAWSMLKFLRDGAWWKVAACVIFMLGATFSKGPGLLHAIIAVGAVTLAFLEPKHVRIFRKYPWQSAGVCALLLAAFWVVGDMGTRLEMARSGTDSRFVGHAYTLSRVFWEFAWRSVIPMALSSDHEITETLIPPGTAYWNIPDKTAMLAAAGFLTLAAFSLVLAWRKSTRLFGLCLFAYIATILFRVFYPIPEFMPEYRIYPGLPWFCLGAAILLAAVWKSLFETLSPRAPAVILLAVFTLLSAKRSFVWHDDYRLSGDVLKRYPARARALWGMSDRDAEAQKWQAIIDRQRTVWPEVERQFVTRNQRLAPAREIPSGDFVLAMVAIFGNYARAIAHVETPMAGLRVMAQLEAHMKLMKMTLENKPLEWRYFYQAKIDIIEMTGNHQAAINLLRGLDDKSGAWKSEIERLEKKLVIPKRAADSVPPKPMQ